MDDLSLLVDLHRDGFRQGPGSEACTKQALQLANLPRNQHLRVADLGCGTGASTVVLAQELNAEVVAVDFLQPFLDVLNARAAERGLSERIESQCCSIDALPFDDGVFDVIWSEGAIYNIGFEEGARSWKRHLRPGGILVVSEITWLTQSRPDELNQFWQADYPQIGLASEKFGILERLGYSPCGYFVLPPECWLNNYYEPIQERMDAFLERNNHSEQAQAIAAAERAELDLYRKYSSFYSYGMYLARVPQ